MSLKDGMSGLQWHRPIYPSNIGRPDRFPSSSSFDLLAAALQDDGERKDAIKKGNAIFAFTLKKGGETADWHIDLKESGKVAKGAAPEGKKANGKLHHKPRIGQEQSVTRPYRLPARYQGKIC
jgi:hypothetical protein